MTNFEEDPARIPRAIFYALLTSSVMWGIIALVIHALVRLIGG